MSRYKSRYESRYERNQSRGYRRNENKKLNLKKVFAVLAIIILSIYIITKITGREEVEIVSPNQQEQQQSNVAVEETKYYLCLDNEKWGVIDNKGNQIVPAEYDEMIQIVDSSKDLFICYYDVDYSKNKYKTKVLNKENALILADFEGVETIINNKNSDEYWYESNILTYKKDGKVGIMDLSGNTITEAIYDDISALNGVNGYLVVTQNNKKGLISNEGNVVLNSEYNTITSNGKYIETKLNKKNAKFSFEGTELTEEEIKQLDSEEEGANDVEENIQENPQISGWELKEVGMLRYYTKQ